MEKKIFLNIITITITNLIHAKIDAFNEPHTWLQLNNLNQLRMYIDYYIQHIIWKFFTAKIVQRSSRILHVKIYINSFSQWGTNLYWRHSCYIYVCRGCFMLWWHTYRFTPLTYSASIQQHTYILQIHESCATRLPIYMYRLSVSPCSLILLSVF